MVRAYYLCSLQTEAHDVTREKLSSSVPGLTHTFIFLSVTFFAVIDHWVCFGRWLDCAAASVRLSRDENSYLSGRGEKCNS